MKRILLIGVALVAVAVAGWWFWFGRSAGVGVGPEISTTEDGEAFTGLLKEAIARGIPMRCTYQISDTVSGTGYIKGEKYFGEMSTEGRDGFVLMKDDCMWSWSKEDEQGMKMCFDLAEGESLWDQDTLGGEGMGASASDTSYRCVPAVVPDSKFDLPSDVEFLDLDQMMMGIEE